MINFPVVVKTSFSDDTEGRPAAEIQKIRVLDDERDPFIFEINYELGTKHDRRARIVRDPKDPKNKVLHFWLKNAVIPRNNDLGFKGRIALRGPDKLVSDFDHRCRIMLHSDMSLLRDYPFKIDWFTVAEFFIGDFRITFDIFKAKGAGNDLHFSVRAQDKINGKWKTVWSARNNNFKVPVDRWIDLRFTYQQGDENDGRFRAAAKSWIKWAKIADVEDRTYNAAEQPSKIRAFAGFKIYTKDKIIDYVREHGGVVQLYLDSLETRGE